MKITTQITNFREYKTVTMESATPLYDFKIVYQVGTAPGEPTIREQRAALKITIRDGESIEIVQNDYEEFRAFFQAALNLTE